MESHATTKLTFLAVIRDRTGHDGGIHNEYIQCIQCIHGMNT